MYTVQVFRDSTETVLVADWTYLAEIDEYEVDEHGYAHMPFFVPMGVYEALMIYNHIPVAHVVLSYFTSRVFEGRIEDVEIVNGGVKGVIFGYGNALKDVPYTALWSTKRFDSWFEATEEDPTSFTPSRWRTDTNERLYFAPEKNAQYGHQANKAGFLFLSPHNGDRKIKEFRITYDVDLPTNWQMRVTSFDLPFFSNTNDELIVTTSGATTTTLTFATARDGIAVQILNNTGSTSTYTGETGDKYAKITDLRILTTEGDASGNVFADEIVKAMITYSFDENPEQLSSSTASVDSPAVDIEEAWWEDADIPGILDELASKGDDSSPVQEYEWGVLNGRALHFRPRGSNGLTWYIDVADVAVNRTIAEMYNSSYAVFTNPRRLVKRTSISDDTASQAIFNLKRQAAVSSPASAASHASPYSEVFLQIHKDTVPRARVSVRELVTISGAVGTPLSLCLPGDTIVLRTLPPSSGSGINKIETFRVFRTKMSLLQGVLQPVPENDPPDLELLVARAIRG